MGTRPAYSSLGAPARRGARTHDSGPGRTHRHAVEADGLPRRCSIVFQDDPASGTPGGTLKIATIGEAPHLDEHQSTAEIIALIGYCAYEGLFTYDATYQAIPELVAEHTVSEDGLTHTMKLRQGVMFHNGEELKAADAIASVERWGRISGVGKRLMEKTTGIDRGRRLHARVEADRAVRHDPDRARPQHPGLHDPSEVDPRRRRRRADDRRRPVHRHRPVQAGRMAARLGHALRAL